MRRTSPPALLLFAVLVIAGGVPGAVSVSRAQAPEGPDTTESTTSDSTGIVAGVSGYYTITLDERRGPFTYRLGQDVHIFGPDNRPLKITEVHPGDEATIYYYFRDNHPTAARIVVLRRAKPPARK